MEQRERIYALLENERKLITDSYTGNLVRSEAWKVIDVLLDSLIELNELEKVVYE